MESTLKKQKSLSTRRYNHLHDGNQHIAGSEFLFVRERVEGEGGNWRKEFYPFLTLMYTLREDALYSIVLYDCSKL